MQNFVDQKLFASSFSGSFCSATSFSSFDNLHVIGPGFSVNELCVWVGVSNGVDGCFGGDDAGVLNIVVVVIFSKNASNCFSDNALCSVSSGLIGGTPPNPSRTKMCFFFLVYFNQYLFYMRLFQLGVQRRSKYCVNSIQRSQKHQNMRIFVIQKSLSGAF